MMDAPCDQRNQQIHRANFGKNKDERMVMANTGINAKPQVNSKVVGSDPELNPVGALQEMFQKIGICPEYKSEDIIIEGKKTFKITVSIGNITAQATRAKKKEAKEAAAKIALEKISEQNGKCTSKTGVHIISQDDFKNTTNNLSLPSTGDGMAAGTGAIIPGQILHSSTTVTAHQKLVGSDPELNPVGALQEMFQKIGICPEYKSEDIIIEGKKTFKITVSIGQISAHAIHSKKKEAKSAAAKMALRKIAEQENCTKDKPLAVSSDGAGLISPTVTHVHEKNQQETPEMKLRGMCLLNNLKTPAYKPVHIECHVGDLITMGTGDSFQEARSQAAQNMIDMLKEQVTDSKVSPLNNTFHAMFTWCYYFYQRERERERDREIVKLDV